MTVYEAVVLGVVQGLTEFLPVSSSGHLVLAQELLGIEVTDDVSFEVVVHVATLVAVVAVFREAVVDLIRTVPKLVQGGWTWRWEQDASFRHFVYLIVATLPIIVIGLLLRDRIESLFARPDVVAGMLIVTGIVLFTTRLVRVGISADQPLTTRRALVMGLAQACALVPGISRSGSTISAGLLQGMDRSACGQFAFLMAIPAICGATILQLPDLAASKIATGPLVAGFLAALVTGVGALILLVRIVRAGRLWVFAPYLVVVGVGWWLWG